MLSAFVTALAPSALPARAILAEPVAAHLVWLALSTALALGAALLTSRALARSGRTLRGVRSVEGARPALAPRAA
jgi:hypothetical protein